MTRRATEAEANELEKCGKDSAVIRAHDHRGTHHDRARFRQLSGLAHRRFPSFRDVDAKPPGRWRIHLVSADNARKFIVRCVKTMGVDRRRACLQPHPRWTLGLLNG